MPYAKANRLLWMDLETTGLDSVHDCILEIGVIATDTDLTALWRQSWLVPQPPSVLDAMSDFLTDMHTRSGLLDELRRAWGRSEPVETLRVADEALAYRMTSDPDSVWALAGSGISHFDRAFVQRLLPKVEANLAYYNIDTGVLRRCLAIFGGDAYDVAIPESFDNDVKAHRAMADVTAHLAEARAYKTRLSDLAEYAWQYQDLASS